MIPIARQTLELMIETKLGTDWYLCTLHKATGRAQQQGKTTCLFDGRLCEHRPERSCVHGGGGTDIDCKRGEKMRSESPSHNKDYSFFFGDNEEQPKSEKDPYELTAWPKETSTA